MNSPLNNDQLSSGKAALNAIEKQGKLINMHHKLPGWAGGTDHGSNLAPVLSGGAESDHNKAHKWWSDKAKAGRDELVKKAKACDDKDKKNKKKGKKKKTDREGCLKLIKKGKGGKTLYKVLAECQLTTVAKCLDKEGSTFTLEISCPAAVTKK